MSEKKTSDIILDLDQKVDKVLKYLQTLEFNYKVLLNKVDNLSSSVQIKPQESPKQENKEPYYPKKTAKSKLEMALEAGEIDQQINSEIVKEQPKRGRGGSSKVPVQQKVLYSDGSNVSLANVEVFTISGQPIKQTRTNSTGRWMCSLDPGEYTISVNKAAGPNKPKIESKYQINVQFSDVPIELNPKSL